MFVPESDKVGEKSP